MKWKKAPRALREREDYKTLLRGDPCAYCGYQYAGLGAGTVDHIVPKSMLPRCYGSWLNYTGCCGSCNEAKATLSLLDFLVLKRRPRSGQG